MLGVETAKYLKKFLNVNNIQSNENNYSGKIILSKTSEKFKKIARNILNEEIKIENE